MHDPELKEPSPARLPTQLWQPWTLIVPAILIIPLLCLASAWQIVPPNDEALEQRHHPMIAPEAAAPTPPPADLPQRPAQFSLFVPGDDDKLHRKGPISFTGGSDSSDFAEFARATLRNLFAFAPKYFPAAAHIQEISLDEETGVARVSLDEAFWNSNYWASDSRSHLAFEAIAHTLDGVYKDSGHSGTLKIQLLRDGQDVDVLGQLDVGEAFPPDPAVVAPS